MASSGNNPPGGSDKALQEFLAESQEIVDAFNQTLLEIDRQRGESGGSYDPDLINAAFRGVHSLKGLSGLFGFSQMIELSHQLETLMDQMRLGKVPAKPAILDLLFEAVELFGTMINGTVANEEIPEPQLRSYLDRLNAAVDGDDAGEEVTDELSLYQLPENLLSVLTEYEEHRLRENIRGGRRIYRIHAAFDLTAIDTGLEQLKERVKPLGEVITYLPSADSIDDTRIELEVLIGSEATSAALRAAIDNPNVEVRTVPRVDGDDTGTIAPPIPPPPPLPGVTATSLPPPPPRAAPEKPSASRSQQVPVEDAGEQGREDPINTIKSVSQTVRVDIGRLDGLMGVVGELSLAQSGIAQVLASLSERGDAAEESRALSREVRLLERRLSELQDGLLEVRMVPLRQVFDKLSRVVRKISRESDKEIRLEITGADTELDKLIVEELSDPLMHLIRNAIDHGIELPSVRAAAGKPEVGTIKVDAFQQGNRVIVTVSDDGGGIDEDRVGQVAISRGLVSEDDVEDMTVSELRNLLFLPGMSTREQATELSGRGVGLDVVKTNIARLSGIIDVSSERGKGSQFSITLPITLAIIQALVVRASTEEYAVPLNSVLESLVIDRSEVQTVEGQEIYTLRSHTLPLVRLDTLFELLPPEQVPSAERIYVVVIGLAQHRLGLVVDELVGEKDIVIKSLGRSLARVRGIAGATELGHQKAVLVLDVPAIVEEALLRGKAEAA